MASHIPHMSLGTKITSISADAKLGSLLRLVSWMLVSYLTFGRRVAALRSVNLVLQRHPPATYSKSSFRMAASASDKNSVAKTSFCAASIDHEYYGPYHDEEYGFPIRGDDNALFGRLLLEMNQAGLSWLTILKKRQGIEEAYDGFDVDTVAQYTEVDKERLRNDARVIRNKLKISAVVFNAQSIVAFRKLKKYGSFEGWLNAHHPLSKPEWVKLFKKHFRFTGGEITKEFLVSLGYLPGAHDKNCIVMKLIVKERPPWMSAPEDFEWDL